MGALQSRSGDGDPPADGVGTSRMRPRRRAVVFALIGAILMGVIAQPPGDEGPRVGGTSFEQPPLQLGFPVGWYHNLQMESSLPALAADGVDASMPYYSTGATPSDAQTYLDQAAAAGIRVLLELPRALVKVVDLPAITTFVQTFESHPALLGWYLADEPSITLSLGPLSAANAALVYGAVKAEDPNHPVAIALHHRENAAAYGPAMDVMMWNEYPCWMGEQELYPPRMAFWRERLETAAQRASAERGFIPIIQAYGGTPEAPQFDRRHCSRTEERYMVYSAIQSGATGLYFWTQYRADPVWVDEVLQPIVAEVNALRPALATGIGHLVRANRDAIAVTTHRRPGSRTRYVIATNHSNEIVKTRFELRSQLRTARRVWLLGAQTKRVGVFAGRFTQTLQPYEVKVFRVS